MRARAAHIETLERSAVVAVAEHRSRREHLVEVHRPVRDVPAEKPKSPLQIERAHDLAAKYCSLEVRSVRVDGVDHEVGDRFAMGIPRGARGELRRDVLTKQTRYVPPGGRQRVIER